ncbi:hypothetical protein D3C75_996720 [compost metagenome]
MHGPGFDYFTLYIDHVAGNAFDDNADVRVGEVFFEFGSDLLFDCRHVQPGDIDAPGQGEGDTAIGKYGGFLTQAVFLPHRYHHHIAGAEQVGSTALVGVTGARPHRQHAESGKH